MLNALPVAAQDCERVHLLAPLCHTLTLLVRELRDAPAARLRHARARHVASCQPQIMARRSVAAAAARTVLFTRRCAASAAGVAGLLERAESGSSSRAVGASESCVKFGALRPSLGVLGRSSSACARAWYGDFGRLVPTAGPAFSFPGVALVLSPESVRFGAGSRRLTFSGVFANSVERAFWPDMAARSRPPFGGELERPLGDATGCTQTAPKRFPGNSNVGS